MLPGADVVFPCPYCQALARVFSLASGNSFGAITWTDGYQDMPMNPRPPRITRCHACKEIYWVGEVPPVGYLLPETEDLPENVAWKAAPYAEPLDEAGFFEAIEGGCAPTPELELELRVAAWWRGNDAFRIDDSPVGHSTSPEAIVNMEHLIDLMKDGAEDLLLFRAEALRHLGRFDEIEENLQGVGCSDYWPAKSKQLELAKSGDRKLRKLFG